MRNGQLLFALFCVGTALVLSLREDGVFPVIQSAGVVGYLLAAPLVTVCAVALGRSARAARARRTLIGFHLLFIPLQFLFSFGNFEPLAGMVLSAVFVVLLKPRFPRLGRRARKTWLTVHIGVAVSWLGLSTAMTVLAVAGLTADTHAVRHGAYELMHLFDLTLVIPSMAVAVLSGLVLSLGTPWGLVRHWWVLLKFVIALSLPTFAALLESKWIRSLQALTKDPAAEPGGTGLALAICLATFTALLWGAVILSVVKPGGRTRWGHGSEGARRYGVRDGVRAAAQSPSAARRTPAPETPVTVSGVEHLADGVVSLELRRTDGRALPPWQPGAHVDLVLPSGKVRQYSLFGSGQDGRGDEGAVAAYRIAVLREPDGRGGSVEAHALRPGATAAIRGPRNNFPLVAAPAYVFLAGGIGITPFLPMIRRLDAEGADWKLLYRGRTRPAMAFADDLLRRYPGRVGVTASDTDRRPALEELLSAAPQGVAVYCCGPAPMLDAVSAVMRTACPHGRLYTERFAAADRPAPEADEPFDAELTRSGEVVRVEPGHSLLEAIREVEPTLDFSCADGVCGSCETRVVGGTPEHRDSVLHEHERDRRDVIYPCVSRARGRRIALDL
ncbi:2Fe-2S iron-sulfur cluster-binding protein [Streptomyces sp. 8N114]|uniref:2Fe-2S iron-sulfur cluster-binding protein n=1 Tax=Streptomyces sp. 8N114 TaxID=3457419 RepID=UPI003FD1FF3E